MIKVLKGLFLVLLFIFSIIVFLPKEKMFDFAVQELKQFDIEIKNYDFQDKYFTFDIDNLNIYYKDIQTIQIEKIQINPFVLKNDVNLQAIKADKSLQQFVPSNIQKVAISYNILKPILIKIKAHSKQFKINGYFDMVESKVVLKITLSKVFKREYSKIVKFLKYNTQTKDYTYEYKL
jgi:hypothetical protein